MWASRPHFWTVILHNTALLHYINSNYCNSARWPLELQVEINPFVYSNSLLYSPSFTAAIHTACYIGLCYNSTRLYLSIGSWNGFQPVWYQAITWVSTHILPICSLVTCFSEFWAKYVHCLSKKFITNIICKMMAIWLGSQCVDLMPDALIIHLLSDLSTDMNPYIDSTIIKSEQWSFDILGTALSTRWFSSVGIWHLLLWYELIRIYKKCNSFINDILGHSRGIKFAMRAQATVLYNDFELYAFKD